MPLPSARPTSIAIDRTHISASSCWPSTRRSSAHCKRCCGRETMLRISKWAAAGLLLAASALANDRYENSMHANVAYNGGRVTIDHRFGRVEVRTTRGDRVTARVTVRASDEEVGKQIHFTVLNSDNGVSIRTIYPSIHIHGGEISYSADLEVSIPERA